MAFLILTDLQNIMDALGINWPMFLAQGLNLIILALWLVLAILALFDIRKRHLPPLPQAIWVALILLIPLLGALAYWIVRPTGQPA